ncbi:DcrB-related protein [Pseudomonas sp. SH1-B]
MSYTTQELSLQLPTDEMQDGTINILRFPALGTSLVITRGNLAADETLRSHFEEQLGKLATQLKDMKTSPISDTCVGPAGDIDAVELRNQFIKGGEQVYQFQLGFIPAAGRIMSLSYVKPKPMGEAEASHWESIKRSLVLNAAG